jgi:hypothetical protein
MLRFVVEGCSWKLGALSFRYKQPFDEMGVGEEAVLPLVA